MLVRSLLKTNCRPLVHRLMAPQGDKWVRKHCPGFPGKDAMMEVEIQAGQMLYLPAGGCSCVTLSFSCPLVVYS